MHLYQLIETTLLVLLFRPNWLKTMVWPEWIHTVGSDWAMQSMRRQLLITEPRTHAGTRWSSARSPPAWTLSTWRSLMRWAGHWDHRDSEWLHMGRSYVQTASLPGPVELHKMKVIHFSYFLLQKTHHISQHCVYCVLNKSEETGQWRSKENVSGLNEPNCQQMNTISKSCL